MKLKLYLLILLSLIFTTAAFAEDAAQQLPPGMTAEQMQKIKAATTPGENHKLLEKYAGKWNYTAKFYMPGQTAPQESTGTSTSELLYGGRFVKDTVKGTWMGQPFEGTGYTGYDNIKGEYQSIWFDNAMTGIMTASGQFDAATKTLKFSGVSSCPITGEKNRACRSESVWADDNHYTTTSYANGPDGKEVKGMELSFTRAS